MSPRRKAEKDVLARIPSMRGGIDKRTVKDLVSEKLESLIASGVLRPGDELPGERELASAFSVSRETLRGAVQGLAARGLLEVSHGARTRVRDADLGLLRIGMTIPGKINSYDIEAVHGARLLVERAVVRDAATKIDAATLGRLKDSLVAQRATMTDPVRFLICDREFHVAIYRSAANPLLADFVTDLYAYMMDYRRRAVSLPGAIRRSYEDHVAIVEALEAGDADAVDAAFAHHLDRIYATTRSLIDGSRLAAAGDPEPPAI